MDTSWIKLPNTHSDYINGCLKFLELAEENLVEGKTKCPCKKCKLRYWFTLNEVEGHILFKGFYQDYTNWIWHGKGDLLDKLHESNVWRTSETQLVGYDDMDGSNKHMYGDEIPKHPVGYVHGVKQSDVFGVSNALKEEEFKSDDQDTLTMENMEKIVADLTEKNKKLVKQHEALQAKYEENNQLLKRLTTQNVLSTGKASTDLLDLAKTILQMGN